MRDSSPASSDNVSNDFAVSSHAAHADSTVKLSAITELESEALVDLEVGDEIAEIDVEPAPDSQRATRQLGQPIVVLSSERTQELVADDILEVAEVAERIEAEEQPKAVIVSPVVMVAEPTQDFTQPLSASMLPPSVRFTPSLPSVIVPATPPTPMQPTGHAPRAMAATVRPYPSSSAFPAATPHPGYARPSSIAPVAVEIHPSQQVVATLQMRALPARVVIARPDRTPFYVLGAAAAVIALAVGGAFAFRASSLVSRADNASKITAPAGQRVADSRNEVPPPDATINADKAVSPLSLPDAPAAHPAAPSHVPVSTAPAPVAPAPATTQNASNRTVSTPAAHANTVAVAPAPAPVRPPSPAEAPRNVTTGVIHVSPSLSVVIVDGTYRRPVNGTVVVSCGPHKVKAGMGNAETVDVPCGHGVSM
ncbi:Vegetative cell wall protein gp1 precursor (Hydroxyproline-rich glycoprotein 1) [Labilithrix luteola]|uniref:Vegetative cell wall protein gp1 (Hydroxyproline-rich glycoprotein 1) n=1 Tax=Labilithrix luteola TaxID=1391654 RepID=A0A0K1PZB6_9BACT|nr:hypothetical protein [Labilithrix luteola]AKU98880.1 Vegetative cell wall protein gp1 precursor (Hydroxyproline-rich glycoprotein 1) [Labilithrix luteola]